MQKCVFSFWNRNIYDLRYQYADSNIYMRESQPSKGAFYKGKKYSWQMKWFEIVHKKIILPYFYIKRGMYDIMTENSAMLKGINDNIS